VAIVPPDNFPNFILMEFHTYAIQSSALKPYIEFILFNHSAEASAFHSLTYYPNHDVCLGIIHEKTMVPTPGGFTITNSHKAVNSYLTGIYKQPHQLEVSGTFDEICLPFTPLGYQHFFPFPLKTYVLGEEVLTEAFGAAADIYFESVFNEKNFHVRGTLLESFLLDKLAGCADQFLSQALFYMHSTNGEGSLKKILFRLQCSEKKLQRCFLSHLDILPKDYLQILRFRKALQLISQGNDASLTSIGYDAGYYDQSHFIRHIHSFTGKTPGELRRQMKSIDDKVLCSVC
jgi:AraC-like DNA-binding protein